MIRFADFLPLEGEALHIMDRGYLDYADLYTIHQADVFFVSHAKSSFKACQVYCARMDQTTGGAHGDKGFERRRVAPQVKAT
jgi:hypothetical protein